MWISIGEGAEAHFVEVVQCTLLGFMALERFGRQQREHHVLLDGFPRRQLVELLEHHDAVRTWLFDLMPQQANLAFAGFDKARDGLEQRGFAATRRAEQHVAVGRVDLETDLVGGPHHALRSAVFQADVIHRQQRRGGVQVAGLVALQGRVHLNFLAGAWRPGRSSPSTIQACS